MSSHGILYSTYIFSQVTITDMLNFLFVYFMLRIYNKNSAFSFWVVAINILTFQQDHEHYVAFERNTYKIKNIFLLQATYLA